MDQTCALVLTPVPQANRPVDVEQRAFGAFFNAHFAPLYRFAKSRLGGEDDFAREVAVASLLKAMRKLASFRGESGLFSWLCSICLREIIDRHRALSRYRECIVLIDDHPDLNATIDGLEDEVNTDPYVTCSRAEIGTRVREVLGELPAHYANALQWKYISGHSVDEIAARLGLGHIAVQSLLARAREAFRDGIRQSCGSREASARSFLEA